MTSPARTVEGGPVPLEAKVAFLSRPDAYAGQTSAIETVETHMSWVFLTDRHAYKLKKPVLLDYLDYTALPARERFCSEELRINGPLAPGVYQELAPLVRTASGRLRIGGQGEVVDWLVKMRRLPLGARLDALIAGDAVDGGRLREALGQLTAFYATSERAGFDAGAYREQLLRAIERNRAALALAAGQLPARTTSRVLARQEGFVRRSDSPLAERAGHVVDAHGDLRPEHVYLLDPPVIVDRLEFDRDLRLLDPADELAFLALECDRLGAPWIESVAFDAYAGATGDRPPAPGRRLLPLTARLHARPARDRPRRSTRRSRGLALARCRGRLPRGRGRCVGRARLESRGRLRHRAARRSSRRCGSPRSRGRTGEQRTGPRPWSGRAPGRGETAARRP